MIILKWYLIILYVYYAVFTIDHILKPRASEARTAEQNLKSYAIAGVFLFFPTLVYLLIK